MPVAVSVRYERKFATALPETGLTCRGIVNVVIKKFDFEIWLKIVPNRESVSDPNVVRPVVYVSIAKVVGFGWSRHRDWNSGQYIADFYFSGGL